MSFSAVILAGGKSSRMGRDKAFLEIGGQTLLARQIEIVRAAGVTEIFISGRDGTDYSAFGCRILKDNFPDTGPLAGIEAALSAAANPLLLVLAVDLPEMSLELLRELSTHCQKNAGAVPCIGGEIEPLAAFYPQAAHFLAAALLKEDANAVKNFAGRCAQSGLAALVDFQESHGRFFKNCNTPTDFFVAGR
jgi:molybdopterin-guanine dinucleotide biosynthesis protein A